jgi:hypothetical protein
MWFVIVCQSARMVPLVALFGTFLVLATSPRLAYAEAKRATGTTGSSVVVVNTLIFLASTLDTGQLQSRSRELISQDLDWNHATVFSTSFLDPAMQLEHKARGHMVITHPGGDQTFLQYEVSWKNVGPIELEWQFLGSFVRGTGKFKGISGTWREGGKSTSTGDGGNWETEYNLP